uniref:Glutathione peroxidase n=1 Tax=Steinernema glaseri TaxID=37863 RepID=A0A1I7ZDT2_9BILA
MIGPLLLSTVLLSSVSAATLEQPGPKLVDEASRWSQCKAQNESIYDFQVETLDGQFTDLSQFKGQVLLVINVATFCGLSLSSLA